MPRPSSIARAIALLIGLSLGLSPAGVLARRQRELAYGFEQTWNAALRLLRVDLRVPVTDRDPEGGYVLFEYLAAGKRYPGSVELVAQQGAEGPATVVVVQVKGMPSYVEQMILDRLAKKLLAEHGPPARKPPPPAAPPPAPSEDAGARDASELP